ADDAIGETKRERVHRARRRYADVPEPEPPRIFLHDAMRARLEHFHGSHWQLEGREESRVLLARTEHLVRQNSLQIVEIRLDAIDAGLGEGLLELRHRVFTSGRVHNDLREQ